MSGKTAFIIGVVASLALAGPTLGRQSLASSDSTPPVASPAKDPLVTSATPGSAVLVTANRHRHRHRVMHFFFGSNRRRGGFFANLFHGRSSRWKTSTYRKQCQQRYRSYDARTNSYRAYSGVRRVCLL